jgi:hypothetical protein
MNNDLNIDFRHKHYRRRIHHHFTAHETSARILGTPFNIFATLFARTRLLQMILTEQRSIDFAKTNHRKSLFIYQKKKQTNTYRYRP